MKAIIKNTVYLMIIALIIGGNSISVVAQSNLKKARELKSGLDFSGAITYYHEHVRTHPNDIAAMKDLAECYLMINDTRSAAYYLSKVTSGEASSAQDVLMYAHVLKSEGKYEDAISQYKRYAILQPSDQQRAKTWVQSCEDALGWIEDPLFYDVYNAESINSEYSDFGLTAFGNSYIFTSDRKSGTSKTSDAIYGWTGNPYLKLWKTDKENPDIFSPGEQLSDLNNEYHNGPGVMDQKSGEFFFTRTRMVKVAKRPVNSDPTSWYDRSSAKNYINRLEIYTAAYSDGKWSKISPFEYNLPEEYSVGHPAISPDGNTLYFSSDMPGGYGDADLYYVERGADGKWSKPVNLGPAINTTGKEVFPVFASDGTLYFSSDGHPGMGGLDIFSAQGSQSTWTSPLNLRYPLNSPRDDFSPYFTEAGKAGYLSSNRDGGKGSDDIYFFSYAPPVNLILVGVTKERGEDQRISILSDVLLKLENITASSAGELNSDENGDFSSRVDCGASYQITASKDGYFTSAASLETRCATRNDTVFVELVLDKIIIDKPIVLENIYYDFDKWNIRPDAAVELDKLVKILLDNPLIEVELGSHTDSRGSDSYNERLSQRRAESAVQYIISRGIDPRRITAKGYGENVPVNDCVNNVKCDEDAHQLNRRTEFKVTKINKK